MSDLGNIVLIGMPGAGKSTLGVVLAKILRKDFVDCDLVIQHVYGSTLQQIIDQCGPEGFIQAEGQTLCALEATGSIISTGGSAIYSPEAMAHLAELGPIVYLQISYDSLVQRLGNLEERGVVLKGGLSMSLEDLYNERLPLYQRYAQITVDVEGLTITEAAKKVAESLQHGTK